MGHLPCRLAHRNQIHPAGAEVIAFQRTDNGHIRQHSVDTRRYDFFRILMQQLIHDRFSSLFLPSRLLLPLYGSSRTQATKSAFSSQKMQVKESLSCLFNV